MASATTGYFDSATTSRGWYARLEYSYSQTTTTKVVLTLKVYNGTTPAYNNNANSAYYEIQGVKTYATYSWSGTSLRTIGTYTFNVPAGQTSIALSAKWVSDVSSSYTPASLSVSGTITVPTIETLKVSNLPSITSVEEGETMAFSVSANGGSGTYSYQWYLGSSAISGATGASYTRVAQLSDNGKTIYCIVKSGSEQKTTNNCTLAIREKVEYVYLKLAQIRNENYIPYVYQNGEWEPFMWDIT